MHYDPSIESAGVIPLCQENGEWKIFLIQHQGYETFWGCPKGHKESHETHEAAARRELKEETGLQIKRLIQPTPLLEEFSWEHQGKKCLKRILFFIAEVEGAINLLTSEVVNGGWFPLVEAIEKMNYPEGQSTLKQVVTLLKQQHRTANVNAYLVLKQQNQVLLHLRKNTGYCDGMWSLIAGHVEAGESATEGMIREAIEEIGIVLDPSHLQVVHVMHRKTNRLNIDVFFECSSWQGEIHNCEPHKCDKLAFFPLHQLPPLIIDYNRLALQAIADGKFYSELGWNT